MLADQNIAVSQPNPQHDQASYRSGVVFALMAQLIWGVFPVYLDLLKPTPAVEVVAHRAIWSFTFLTILVCLASWRSLGGLPSWSEMGQILRNRTTMGWLLGSAVLILINWLGFVVAIELDRTMDASIGYYICPQVVVLLGVIFQKEKLARIQWVGFACSSVGLLIMAVSTRGVPWLGLVVAFSFGFYALLKKRIDAPVLASLTIETGFIFPPALMFLLLQSGLPDSPTPDPTRISSFTLTVMLVLTGIVTITPLALYGAAVRKIPLSLVGLIQFVGPTLQFLLSVFVFHDVFDKPRVVGIVLVWIGVAFYLWAMNRRAVADRG